VRHSSWPVFSLRATTVPRVLTAASLVSPYSAEVPMKTLPSKATGLP
jgi:hypothetical protein